jgi:uridine phosphorylase
MGFQSQRMVHADGKMHHLGTDERDVAPVMLLTAGMEEVSDIAKWLDAARQTGLYREYRTFLGQKNNRPVGVMSSGHGCMPMAIAVEELNHLGAKTLIKVGVGNALQPGIQPGSLVVPVAAVRGEGASKEYVGLEYPAIADIDLLGRLVQAAKQAKQTVTTGICRSHDSFYAEYPAAGQGANALAQWQQLGVVLLEHELSSMFTLSTILKLRAAASYVVEENLADGTKLTESELGQALNACYAIAAAVAGDIA